jgi:site-specific DNA-methyltransferase (adenine-specific)
LIKLIIGDCRDLIKDIPDNSVDLAILDPPYYKIIKNDWDRQWKTFDEYLDWLEGICLQVRRTLKDNGSLYVFGDDERIAYIQVRLDRHFTLLNNLVWYKRNNMGIKGAWDCRRFVCVSERILFYGFGDKTGLKGVYENPICFTVIKDYLNDEKRKSGLTNKDFNRLFSAYYNKIGCLDRSVIEHYWQTSQWVFPTKEIYENVLQSTGFFQREYEDLRREYEDLRREYEDLRREYEDLRRPFNYRPKMYEVFDIPIIGGKDNTPHPTTKPRKLIRNLILCSTNEGALVLDPFVGSGTTLLACKETGRNCIAFEKDASYEPIIRKRARMDVQELTDFCEVTL